MAITFGIFHDAALTQIVDSGDPIDTIHPGASYTDVPLWYGSPAADAQAEVTADPGVDPITVTPVDAASGSGQPTTAIKLATSQAGLAVATAGAALEIGTTILSGTANAFPFWARFTNALTSVAAYTDLSLYVCEIDETPV